MGFESTVFNHAYTCQNCLFVLLVLPTIGQGGIEEINAMEHIIIYIVHML